MKAPPEKLGSFYLGSVFDLKTGKLTSENVNYDARDLTTHAVCLGMTGSGKTGLCICLLEEAAIDKVPAILIDPKGDITNHLLHFPELRPEDFVEWVNLDDARRKGLTREDYSAQVAETWRKGLEEWGIDSGRIKLLEDSTDFTIYTPGSSSGVPVNILSSLESPGVDDPEIITDLITGTVSALLELANLKVDAIRSREAVLLSTIFNHYWRNGQNLSLEKLIKDIMNPPFSRLGVFEVETFYPQKERQELALSLNSLIASPGFSEWLTGEPLNITNMLYTEAGKPRHSIFYLAHLNDEERMFFVTMLLERISTWMQQQSGTTSLRALVYFDEVFGFMPPVANPPSKTPLLRLLKQARAFGLGLVLVTQNPVDLDYKGLTNTGTWFIGKLQTERDKLRVLEGLTSAVEDAHKIRTEDYSNIIGSLSSRVFLMHNVHSDGPTVFHTRWAMNYLRGPLTRVQIQKLMSTRKHAPIERKTLTPVSLGEYYETPPHTDLAIEHLYLINGSELEAERTFRKDHPSAVIRSREITYSPTILASYSVRFYDKAKGIDKVESQWAASPEPDDHGIIDWSMEKKIESGNVVSTPPTGSKFSRIPDSINTVKDLENQKKRLSDYLSTGKSLTISIHKELGLSQDQNESHREFMSRVQQAARERRDNEIDELRSKYQKKIDQIETKISKLTASLSSDEAEYEARKREEMLGIGETVLGIFMGRKRTTGVTTASRRRRMTTKAKHEIDETKRQLEVLNKDLQELELELRDQVAEITEKWDRSEENIQDHSVTPRKSDVSVDKLRILWVPSYIFKYNDGGNDVEKSALIRV